MLLIRRYKNRKLYNTSSKKYTNLSEILYLVNKNIPFCVIEHKTEKDMTDLALKEIIAGNFLNIKSSYLLSVIRNINSV